MRCAVREIDTQERGACSVLTTFSLQRYFIVSFVLSAAAAAAFSALSRLDWRESVKSHYERGAQTKRQFDKVSRISTHIHIHSLSLSLNNS